MNFHVSHLFLYSSARTQSTNDVSRLHRGQENLFLLRTKYARYLIHRLSALCHHPSSLQKDYFSLWRQRMDIHFESTIGIPAWLCIRCQLRRVHRICKPPHPADLLSSTPPNVEPGLREGILTVSPIPGIVQLIPGVPFAF